MPELPEVETVRDGLARHVTGRVVSAARVLREYSVRRQDGGPVGFVDQVLGQRLTAVARRGKYLWIELSDSRGGTGHALLAHLGMSGQLLIGAQGREPHRHLRVELELGPERDSTSRDALGRAGEPGDEATREQSGDVPLLLDFVDQRTFGHLAVVDLVPTPDGAPGGCGTGRAAVPEQVAHIGRDLLDPALDRERLVSAIGLRKSGIKRALLDQTLTSGIGNIYADEALWRARLHYDTPCNALPTARINAVLDAARDVMTDALAAGGTSFDSLYVNVNGESGYFSRSLDAYGRAGQPCHRCGTALIRDAFMNRSAFLCPRCQVAPVRL